MNVWPGKMTVPNKQLIRLDLNNPVFQDALFALQKEERLAVLDTLKKLRQLHWPQLYADKGLRWEKIASIKPPEGISALYSLRITRSCRATAFRDGDFLRFLTIHSDHDATYGKK
ncbi:hypothetical protein [Desulfovibrio desulfuricans]|uniref:hypothetical protein n=1 Tax=Desulfovibrio desulfuricans TaxID=876 RepID=UPI001C4353A4|nr:hypothetical protein [Desulfovibrio desulfuricans]